MFSVRQRISTITQPRNGLISVKLFHEGKIDNDGIYIDLPSGTQQLVGLCVDYLTRFLGGIDKDEAFSIPLLGASMVGESKKAKQLIKLINVNLDKATIINAYRLCGYDVVVRRSATLFKSIDEIQIDENLINNIRILVQRTTQFLTSIGGITDSGVTFEGGYNKIISTGDCDFLTHDTLWDLKVSQDKKLRSQYTLQLAIYYLLGLRSIHHDRFKKIKKLGIINPLTLKTFIVNLTDIPKERLLTVALQVIGYDIKNHQLTGTNEAILADAKRACTFYFTDFDPRSYEDGIYDITLDDYCTYYKTLFPSWNKPKFKYTKSIKFLKHSGFYMFVSVSAKNIYSCFDGGRIYHLIKPLSYYYDNLPAYCHQVLKLFKPYWDALFTIANKLKTVPLSQEFEKQRYLEGKKDESELSNSFQDYLKFRNAIGRFQGNVHGFIIDLDFFNHLYINPLDGSVHAYCADDMKSRNVYKSPETLIKKNLPSLYPGFKNLLNTGELPLLENASRSLITTNNHESTPAISSEDAESIHMKGTDIYSASSKLYKLQRIYQYHLVVKWYPEIMESIKRLNER